MISTITPLLNYLEQTIFHLKRLWHSSLVQKRRDRIVDRIGDIFKDLPNFETEALQSKLDMNQASDVVTSLGLETHHDHQKNWDT